MNVNGDNSCQTRLSINSDLNVSLALTHSCHKGRVHPRMNIFWNCPHPQIIQDWDEYVSNPQHSSPSVNISWSQKKLIVLEALLWIMDLNVLMLDLFLTNTACGFSRCWLMYWSGADYLWVTCDVFISCLDSHSDGTHSLQIIHWWASDVMLHLSKSDEETNSSTSWMAWTWVNVQQM